LPKLGKRGRLKSNGSFVDSKHLKQGLTRIGPVLSIFYILLIVLGLVVYSRSGSWKWPLAMLLLIVVFETFRLAYARTRK